VKKTNREFLGLNSIADGIMRKESTIAKLTEYEIEHNKKIFTPLNLFCILFNWGQKSDILPARSIIFPLQQLLIRSADKL
jgi:hypothetical protein